MGIFLSVLFFLYICAMVCIVPSAIYGCLLLALSFFLPPSEKATTAQMVALIAGLLLALSFSVGGWAVLKALSKRIDAKTRKITQTVAPAGFCPSIQLYGKNCKQYLGISPTTNGMVLVDLHQKVTRYESMDLLQGFKYEESNKGFYKLTIMFNSYVVPSMTFTIGGDRRLNDLIAQLNYAMQGGGRQYGPEVAEESIRAFESLKTKYGIRKKITGDDLPPESSPA